MAVSPLKADPSRTSTLRMRFAAEMTRRFFWFRKKLNELVIKEDALGLGPAIKKVSFNALVVNQRWRFLTDSQKIEAFKQWTQEQVDLGVLEVGEEFSSEPWTSPYIESAHKKGAVRAFTDANKLDLDKEGEFYLGRQSQFLEDAFNSPTATKSLKLLQTRTFEELKGVTAAMSQQLGRQLADGLARGDGAEAIARRLSKTVTGITRTRAKVIARTEIIHAHAEGQLDALEELGLEDVGVLVEWSVAGDDRVCPLCETLQGVVLKIDKARGILPRHPNCRCTFIPAGVAEVTKDQKKVADGIRASIKAEKPKLSFKKAKRESKWFGASKI